MKFLLFIMIAIQSFAFTTQDIEDLRYSIKDSKFPQQTPGGLTLTNITVSDKGVVKFFVDIDAKQFQKDTGQPATENTIKSIRSAVLGQYKRDQVVGLCSSKATFMALNRDITFVYEMKFNNGLKFGETKITKNLCTGIKTI